MAMFYALVVLCLSGSALAQSSARGRCPCVTVQQNFDLDGFTGRWYEVTRHYHNFEYTSDCNVIDYFYDKNRTLVVTNNFMNKITKKPGGFRVPINVPNKKEPAKMLIHMPMTPPGTISNYWILGTDYDSYVVIWGCTVFEELNLTYGWILTRDPIPKPSVMAKANRVISRNKLDRFKFFNANQKGCKRDDDDDDDDSCSHED